MDTLLGTIKAVAVKKLDEGEIGFLTQENPDHWFNAKGPTDALSIILKDILQRGNFVEFEIENNQAKNFKLKAKARAPEKKNWAEDMTNFEDLLSAAHEKGLTNVETEMISVDFTTKKAVFKATVRGYLKAGGSEHFGMFTGYGDAEGITNTQIQPHFMRMAETRAIVRALRWYTNNAQVAEEETDPGADK